MKVSIVGAGQVGAASALSLVEHETVEQVVLLDIIEDFPQGKALDMTEATPVLYSDSKIIGSNDFSDMEGSDIVVQTAGSPRKPGMDRIDLLKINLGICKDVVKNVKQYAPDSMILYVANPLDILTFCSLELSGFEKNKVFGMAGILDTSRFRSFIGMETGLSVKDISAIVLGGHGDSMVPLPRYATISGIPVSHFLDEATIERLVKRTRGAGGEIVSLLKTGSAYYAPAAAIWEMIDSIVKDQKRVLPICAYLDGEYGYSGVCAGVPCVLGKDGVEKIIELDLTAEEKAAFATSVGHLQDAIKEIRDMGEL